jgi:ketosteroid isomerase-like protein
MRIYAKDIAYVIPAEREVHGLSAIAAMERQGMESADLLHATHTTHDLRVAGDLAYEIGTIEGPLKPAGKPARTVTFHFMALWQQREHGDWRLRYLVGRPEDRRR